MNKLLIIFSLFSTLAFGHSEKFLPENDLAIPEKSLLANDMTEEQFLKVIKELDLIYTPVVKKLGGNLRFDNNWKSSTVNAYAGRYGKEDEDGNEMEPKDEWRVTMFGGLARHKHVTRDGFSLVVCHEIGHHLAGKPSYDGEMIWASSEGQSDYFATTKCLRRLWQDQDNTTAITDLEIPETLKASCLKQWSHQKDQSMCLRLGMAGFSVGKLFASLKTFPKLPKFETPDTKITKKPIAYHPDAQCRLDTYFQGSLCEVSFEDEFGTDEAKGACHTRNGHKIGLRPLCWYKPVD